MPEALRIDRLGKLSVATLDQTVSALWGDVPGDRETTWRTKPSFDRLKECAMRERAIGYIERMTRWSVAKPR
jgi:hypothetical protein